jgi:hypothetical protein
LAQYDYVLVNDALEHAGAELDALVAHERARLAGRTDREAAAIAERLRRGNLDPRPWLT